MSTNQAASPAPRPLALLERGFFERVTGARPSDGRSRNGSDDAELRVVGGPLEAAERVDIYREAYAARLCECLADDYPAVAQALGRAAFDSACLEFIFKHPPQSSSLNYYGALFAQHLAARGGAQSSFASDLARLEWAVVEVIHADAGLTLDAVLEGVSADDWARLRLVPSHALRVISSAYPLHPYYQAFLDGENPPAPEPSRSAVTVCRRGNDVWRASLSPPLAALLGRLMAGQPLLSALEALSDGTPSSEAGELTATLQRAFGEWVACGFFSAIAIEHGTDDPPTSRCSPSSGAIWPAR